MGRPIKGQLQRRGRIWHMRLRHDGVTVTRSLDTPKRNEAERRRDEEAALIRLAIRRGTFHAEYGVGTQSPTTGKGSLISIADAWRRYMVSPLRRNPGKDTLKRYESHWRRFAAWSAGNHRGLAGLGDVTKDIARQFASELRQEVESGGLKPGTYNKYIRFLHMFFSVLLDEMEVDSNPWHGIRSLPDDPFSRRNLPMEEIRAVTSKAVGEMLTLVLLGIHTGMRLIDCCLLLWHEVDFDNQVILRVPTKTRRTNKKPTGMPISSELLGHLTMLHDSGSSGYVSPDIARRYLHDVATVTNEIRALFESCGIRVHAEGTGKESGTGRRAEVEVGFHSFRHSFVSRCSEAGVDPATVCTAVGWGNTAMAERYTHVSRDHMRSEMAKLSPAESVPLDADPVEEIIRKALDLAPDDLRRVEARIHEITESLPVEPERQAVAV